MATHTVMETERTIVAPSPASEAPAYGVSAGYRIRYIVRFGVVVLCGAVAAGAIAYALLASDLGDYAENLTIVSGVRQSVAGAAAVSALVQAALAGAVVTALALFASHKVAGPVTRLIRCFRDAARGALPGPVHFRKGDQVGKLEDRFNTIGRLLTLRHERLRQKLEDVRAAAQELRRVQGDPAARQAAAQELRERSSELARLLAGAAQGE